MQNVVMKKRSSQGGKMLSILVSVSCFYLKLIAFCQSSFFSIASAALSSLLRVALLHCANLGTGV